MIEKDLNIKINANKSKVLVFNNSLSKIIITKNIIKTKIKLKNDKTIDQVQDIIYLDSTLSSNRRCKKEVINKYTKLR